MWLWLSPLTVSKTCIAIDLEGSLLIDWSVLMGEDEHVVSKRWYTRSCVWRHAQERIDGVSWLCRSRIDFIQMLSFQSSCCIEVDMDQMGSFFSFISSRIYWNNMPAKNLQNLFCSSCSVEYVIQRCIRCRRTQEMKLLLIRDFGKMSQTRMLEAWNLFKLLVPSPW